VDTVVPPALEATGVSVRFGGLVALDDVSVRVPASGFVGLLGPNGAGKTTLFGVLSGLLRPGAGRVSMDGVEVTGSSPQSRARRGLARTFQRHELFGELTVREHVVVARRVRERRARFWPDVLGLTRREPDGERPAVDAVLDVLGLRDVADRPAASLPLGTGRLVEVARAVASQPRVLLLDEPSSGLDGHETERLAHALRALQQEHGMGLLLVEHNVELVLDLAQRVTVLDFGQVIADGTAAEIRTDGRVQRGYLGTGDRS
jgi:branched-chain amino acid transport system ATP-binding protein